MLVAVVDWELQEELSRIDSGEDFGAFDSRDALLPSRKHRRRPDKIIIDSLCNAILDPGIDLPVKLNVGLFGERDGPDEDRLAIFVLQADPDGRDLRVSKWTRRRGEDSLFRGDELGETEGKKWQLTTVNYKRVVVPVKAGVDAGEKRPTQDDVIRGDVRCDQFKLKLQSRDENSWTVLMVDGKD